MSDVSILIQSANNKVYTPIVLDGVTWETERKGMPSRLNFTVLNDSNISFSEGNKVQLNVDGKPVFIGFIFSRSRDKSQLIKCTAYDQLRYFKNKDTLVYTNKTASEVLKMLAGDYGLVLGNIDDTGYKIKQRDEDNQTLFDIVLNALDLTLDATGQVYVLYDDVGKIVLKNINNMKYDLLIDGSTAENFEYETSIDKDTYNKVKVIQESNENGIRNVYDEQDDENVKSWGVLQYLHIADKGANGDSLAAAILKAKNRKTRTLRIKKALGDIRIRAGCTLPVTLSLGDTATENQFMLCESVTHTFTADRHSMDIEFFNMNSDNAG